MKKEFFIDADSVIKYGYIYSIDKQPKSCYTSPMIKSLKLSDDLSFVVLMLAAWVLICHPLTIILALYLLWGKYVINAGIRCNDVTVDRTFIVLSFLFPWFVMALGLILNPKFVATVKGDFGTILDNRIYTLVIHNQKTKPSENETAASKYEGARRH